MYILIQRRSCHIVGETKAAMALSSGNESVIEELKTIYNSVGFAAQEVLKQVATDIAVESSSGTRSYDNFVDHFNNFVKNGAFSAGLPVGPVKKLLNVYVAMWNDQRLAQDIMENIFQTQINEDIEDENIPPEVLDQGQENKELYRKALKQGKEKVQNIRLMVVGMFQVGKTSLVNNLIHDFKNQLVPASTEGIEVHKCKIVDDKWLIHTPSMKDKCIILQEEERHIVEDDEEWLEMPSKETEVIKQSEREVDIEQPSAPKTDFVQRRIDVDETELKQPIRSQDQVDNHPSSSFVDEVANKGLTVIEVEKSNDVRDVPYASVWDFAGQNIYYTTHHFFLNNRSIYLLLMDVSKPLKTNDKDCSTFAAISGGSFTSLDAFKFWLKSIHLYSTFSGRKAQKSVILVGTHKDKLEGTEEDKEQQMEDYFDNALSSFINSPILDLVYKKKFLVDNLEKESPVIDEIKKSVKQLASEQFYWNDLVPAKWLELEKCLDEKRLGKKELVEIDEIKQAAGGMTFPITGEKELRLFLTTHHLLGNLLYFETEKLKHKVILNPKWTIEAFRTFINHVKNKEPRNIASWEDFKKMAILKPELIDEIMDQADKCVANHKEDVISYMEKLDIIARPVDGRGQEENIGIAWNTRYHNFHIVPCLLKQTPTLKDCMCSKKNKQMAETRVLAFVFKENFMPPAVFHRLLASALRRWEVAKKVDDMLLYNGLGVFKLDQVTRLALWYQDYIIYCKVSVTSCRPMNTLAKKGDDIVGVRKCLTEFLKEISDFLQATATGHRQFEEYVQCDCTCDHNKGLIRVKEFEFYEEIECHAQPEPHPVSKTSALELWFK